MVVNGTGWRRWLRTDLLLGAIAVVTGIGGASMGSNYLNSRAAAAESAMKNRFETRSVVVATSDLQRGAIVAAADLALRSVPREYVPPDFVAADAAGAIVGGRLAVNIGRGLPIATSAIAAASSSALASVLSANERALTLSVDELSSQAGGLRAGDFVDLYYGQRANGDAVLTPLLQMTEILAVGDAFTTDGQGGERPRHFATVTLRVRIQDAPRILVAQQAGDISVLLRARGDSVLQEPRVFNSRELLRTTSSFRTPAGIELLKGGAGGEAPARTWLRVGGGSRGGNS